MSSPVDGRQQRVRREVVVAAARPPRTRLRKISRKLPATRLTERGVVDRAAGRAPRPRPAGSRARAPAGTQNTGASSAVTTAPPMVRRNTAVALRAELAQQPQRVPRVDEQGLHVALAPAGALAQPVGRAWLFASSPVVDSSIAVVSAEAGEAQAEVGVLGDVVGVPAEAAPRARPRGSGSTCPPSGIGAPIRCRPGQEDVEPGVVLEREPAGEQVLTRVVVAELRLQAGHRGVRPLEAPRPPS